MKHMAKRTKFSSWLNAKYHDWAKSQYEDTGRTSMSAFAGWLGFGQSTFSAWVNGRNTPDDQETAVKLAEKLGDEVYVVLGVTPPDPALAEIIGHWPELPKEARQKMHSTLIEAIENARAKSAV